MGLTARPTHSHQPCSLYVRQSPFPLELAGEKYRLKVGKPLLGGLCMPKANASVMMKRGKRRETRMQKFLRRLNRHNRVRFAATKNVGGVSG
mmetsp:Transcript_18309/g.52215  ORF Transcript_18309/g.52215 Transcript_18309/m.52215 type:complete len:92 (-) Transcript_18309:737-1012(-)